MKIGIIGVGKMASAIIKGLKQTPHELIISGSSLERSKEIAEQLTLPYAMSHQDLIDQVDLVILGIKPQLFETVLKPLHFKQPIISMAAGISLQRLATFVGQDLPLLRIMPNMNAQILQSSTALTGNALVSQELQARVRNLTDSFGSTFDISEKDFDTFTALAKAGVKNGMPKAKALEIVTQTVLASASNLKTSSQSPHDFIDAICSPGGTTIAGLMELERLGLTTTVSSAIDKTIDKAKSL